MSRKRILITGSTGFIGSETFESLNNNDLEARAFEGDVRQISDWQKNLEAGDMVLLIAGVRTETALDFAVNTGGIENLFIAAARLDEPPRKVILASSQAVYMGNKPPFEESQKPIPTTIYGKSKLKGEKMAEKWCKELGIPLVILRYSTVLGSGVREKSKMSGQLFAWTKAATIGEPIKIFQDGKQNRDYIHVSDVVNANLLAIDSLNPGIYNVGGGVATPVLELATWIKEATGSKSELVILGGNPNPQDPKEMFSDTTKLTSYGWNPKRTAKEAVREFVALQIF